MNIIEKIAKDKIIEQIIRNVTKNHSEDYNDLAQDLYSVLLEKDCDLIEEIYEKGQLNYYITRLVINNINSKTSRFYYTYRKNKSITNSIEDANAETGERAKYDRD